MYRSSFLPRSTAVRLFGVVDSHTYTIKESALLAMTGFAIQSFSVHVIDSETDVYDSCAIVLQ